MCFWNPTSPHYLHCFTPFIFAPPSQNSPTPLYSQQSSLSGSAEMEDLCCQLLTRNCPLAIHLLQHKSLNLFCLKGADPVLVLPCSPHSSHADLLMIPTQQASSYVTTQQPALLFAGRLIRREPPDPVAPLLHCIIEAILTPHSVAPSPPLQLYFSPQHFSLYGMLII